MEYPSDDEDDTRSLLSTTEDEMEDTASSLKKKIDGAKKGGRKAKARAEDLNATRTSEVASASGAAVLRAGTVVADVFAPGAGAAVGGAMSAKAIHDKEKQGRSGVKQTARQGASTAIGFIPIVGPFLGFAEEVYTAGKAIFEPSKKRTNRKLQDAQRMRDAIAEQLDQLPAIYKELNGYDGTDRAELLKRVQKAEQRMRAALESADAWMAKKSDHGTLPLTATAPASSSSSSSSSAAASEDADEDDAVGVARLQKQIDELRGTHEIFKLLEISGNCPYDLKTIRDKDSVFDLLEIYRDLIEIARWKLSEQETTQLRQSQAYGQWHA